LAWVVSGVHAIFTRKNAPENLTLLGAKFTVERLPLHEWRDYTAAHNMESNYFARYVPLLIHACAALGMAVGMIVLTSLLGKKRYSRAKMQPYECGITPTGDARERFSVKFFMVGILFILFDVEAIFLYPWAVIYRELKMFGFVEMMVYIAVVVGGFLYMWKKGVLDWAMARPQPKR